MSFKSLKLN